MRIGSMWRALVVGATVLMGMGEAAAQNRFWFQQAANAPVTLEAPAQAFVVESTSPASVAVRIASTTSTTLWMTLRAPQGQTLQPGAYENATSWDDGIGSAVVQFDGAWIGCSPNRGRFTVLEAVWDNNQLVRFAANFERWCPGTTTREFGELRLGSTVPFTVEKPAGNTSPDPFAFNDRTLLTPDAEVLSSETTLYGMTADTPISITGGAYSLNGGAFVTTPGVARHRDRVRIRANAPSAYDMMSTATLTVGTRSVPFRMSTYPTGTPVTVARLEGTANDPILAGLTQMLVSPEVRFFASRSQGSVLIDVRASDSSRTTLNFVADGPMLLPGVYENAENANWRGSAPGLWVSTNSRSCSQLVGRFVVLEAAYAGDGSIERFAADFEQTCSGSGNTPMYGEIRYNSSIPLLSVKPAGSTVPHPFAFKPAFRASPGTTVISGATTVLGINAPAGITVTGGEYSINGAAFTSSAGTVSNRDRVRVRTVAAATPGAVSIAQVDIEGVQGAFNVTTYAPGQTLSGVSFESREGDPVGQGIPIEALAPNWNVVVREATPHRVRVEFVGPGSKFHSLELETPTGQPIAPGRFENALRADTSDPSVGIHFFGSHYCSRVEGRFVVHEYSTTPGAVRIAIDFEQRCDGSSAGAAFGELRIDSSVPLRRFKAAGSVAPNPFAFEPRIGVKAGVEVISAPAYIFGTNAPAPISVAGGEYRVNGGAFTSAAGTVSHGDRVEVRLTSSNTAGESRTATVAVGGVSAPFTLTTFGPGVRVTGFTIDRGRWPAGPARVEGSSPEWRISPDSTHSRRLRFWLVGGQQVLGYSLDAWIERGEFAPGTYEMESPATGRFSVSLTGLTPPCYNAFGRLHIFELQLTNGVPTRFAGNYELRCDGNLPMFIELRLDSDVPMVHLKAPGTTLPDPFLLQAPGIVLAGQTVVSNTVALHGANAPMPISIIGGEYSLNGGPFTTAAGTAQPMDLLAVRATAPATPGETRNATVTVGGRSVTFAVHAFESGTDAVSAIAWRSPLGEYVARGTQGIVRPPEASIVSSYSPNGAYISGGSHVVVLESPSGPLVPGRYENATNQFTGTQPRVNVTIGSVYCPRPITGRFVVHEAVYENGYATKFAADIEQHCDGPNTAPLFVEVRLNSSVPVSLLTTGACDRDTDGDGIDDCIEWDQQRNPFIRDNDVFADARLFAEQVYRDFLAREGDAAGIDYWAGRISSGAVTRGAVIEQFLNSPEFGGVVAPVARLYFAYFLRIPDKAGLDFWVDYRLAGNAMESISNAFAGSAEFASTYGALDNAAFVDRVYRNVLGRAPDAGGLAHWRGELDAGRMTRGQVMLAFSESFEYAAITTHEIFVVMTYLAMLQRAPDAGGFAFWVDYMDKGNSGLALINGFLGAAEYRARFLP